MNFAKYKNLLFQKIKRQISQWFDSDSTELIPNDEVYRFLHTLKGSAGTLQLGGLFQLSGSLLERVKGMGDKQWKKEELKDFLYDLISLTYDYESFIEIEKTALSTSRDERIPLIQIIDDDVSMLILLKDVLEQKGWMVIANTTPEKAISQYYDVNPDCVIIDVHLPKRNGIEILEELERHTSKMFVPKIMISILSDRETRINAFRKGADDFIEKPIDFEELTVKIERHLKRKQVYEQSVLLDELTNLYNRKFLANVYSHNINDLKRNKQPFSLAMLDLDHFKKVNDQYGHLVGDKVLASFASFIKNATRSSDTVIRYGGEEFLILFPNTNLHLAMDIVSRILEDFSKQPFNAGENQFSVTFSAGVYSVMDPNDTLEKALNCADQALYKAKESGRARVESMSRDLPEMAKRKLYLSIIDDDGIIRTMLTRVFKSMILDHYEADVQAFENGIKFFESNRLQEHGEHFLILDGVMPVMDGLEILKRVKSSKYDHNVLVLMLTGRKNEADIALALKYGADDYITKPFSIKELQARIERLIQKVR
jgi:two-component system cell cycle response regulator